MKHANDLKAKRILPLELNHSWPIYEQSRQFDLGHVLNSTAIDLIAPPAVGNLAMHHAGCWECDLTDQSLIWSGGVYDIFGLPRGVEVSRDEAVSFYCEESRAAMERLRAHAIKHNRGFTIDVEIKAAIGEHRWVRLIGAPVYRDGQPVRLHGLKLII